MSETTGLSDSQKWLILAVVAGTGALVYLLGPVLAPFMASALLAYLGDPLVDRLEARKLSRTAGVAIVFVGMLGFATVSVMIIFPALEQQVVVLAGKLPQLLIWADERLLPWLNARFGLAIDIDPTALRDNLTGHWGELSSVLRNVLMQLGRSSQALLGWVSFLFLVPMVTFYLLRDWDVLVHQIRELIPRRYEPRLVNIVSEIDLVLAEFLRGQLTLMAALATIYVVGLWAVGLELAFSIGTIAGMVSFVPYMGVIVGVLLASGAALLQYGDLWHLLAVAGVFGIGQTLEGMVLSPMLVGERIGLHPVAVIFAVMAGGQLFGFVGVLLALPAAAAVVVLLRHSRDEYKRSSLYDRAPTLPP
jgi:predicted PurR-regulated permease PerM